MSGEPDMVERVARAIAGHFGPEFDELPADRKAQRESIRRGDAYCDNQSEMLAAARAAIEAMRVPTMEMLVSATEEWLCIRAQEDRAEVIWDAMISCALGHSPPRLPEAA